MPEPSLSEPVNTNRALRLSQRAAWAAGQPISALLAQALARPELISLAAGFVDQQTLPAEPTQAAFDAIFSDPDRARVALQYGTTAGHPPLREAIRDRMQRADRALGHSTEISIDQIVVTAGSNQLLQLVSETLFDPGDIVLCSAPSYFVYLGTLANLGVRTIGVAMDRDGLIPDAVESQLAHLESTGELPRLKAIYCTSYYDNPSGVSLSLERRGQLVEIARRWSHCGRIHVIEDAAYRELRYASDDLPSLKAFDPEGDTVIVAGTFSKSFSPGVRVGWGVLPSDLIGPVLEQKGNFDFGSPNLAQHLMHTVIDLGLYQQHIELLRDGYLAKLAAMLEAADATLRPLPGVDWIVPTGGLYVWLTLPESIDTGPAGPLFERAEDAGVLYVPGEYCFPREGPRPSNTIRLSFGVQGVDAIDRGMRALAQAIGEVVS